MMLWMTIDFDNCGRDGHIDDRDVVGFDNVGDGPSPSSMLHDDDDDNDETVTLIRPCNVRALRPESEPCETVEATDNGEME